MNCIITSVRRRIRLIEGKKIVGYEIEIVESKYLFVFRMENCSRPFIAQRVPFSNLILLVVRTTCKSEDYGGILDDLLSIHAEEVDYNTSLACRIREDDLYRKRYAKCINRHDNVSDISLILRLGSPIRQPSWKFVCDIYFY